MCYKARFGLKLSVLALIGLALPFTQALATIYKWVDEQGNVSYSDTPHAGAQQLDLPSQTELPEAHIGDGLKTPSQPQSEPQAQPPSDRLIQYQVSISQPLQEATIWTGNGDVEIQTSVEPAPASGVQYQYLLDGKPFFAKPIDNSFATLTPVDRGTHEVQVELLNSTSDVIARSTAVTIYVHRPSILNPPAALGPNQPLTPPLQPLSNTILPLQPPTPQPLTPPIQPLHPPKS